MLKKTHDSPNTEHRTKYKTNEFPFIQHISHITIVILHHLTIECAGAWCLVRLVLSARCAHFHLDHPFKWYAIKMEIHGDRESLHIGLNVNSCLMPHASCSSKLLRFEHPMPFYELMIMVMMMTHTIHQISNHMTHYHKKFARLFSPHSC